VRRARRARARAGGALQRTRALQGPHQSPWKRRAERVLTRSGARARPQVDGRVIAVDLAQWVVQACEMRIEPGSQTREARCVRIASERVRPARPRRVAAEGARARSLRFQGCPGGPLAEPGTSARARSRPRCCRAPAASQGQQARPAEAAAHGMSRAFRPCWPCQARNRLPLGGASSSTPLRPGGVWAGVAAHASGLKPHRSPGAGAALAARVGARSASKSLQQICSALCHQQTYTALRSSCSDGGKLKLCIKGRSMTLVKQNSGNERGTSTHALCRACAMPILEPKRVSDTVLGIFGVCFCRRFMSPAMHAARAAPAPGNQWGFSPLARATAAPRRRDAAGCLRTRPPAAALSPLEQLFRREMCTFLVT